MPHHYRDIATARFWARDLPADGRSEAAALECCVAALQAIAGSTHNPDPQASEYSLIARTALERLATARAKTVT